MYICVCNKVTDRQIRQAAEQGAVSIDCLQRRLNLGVCCGKCKPLAEQILQSHASVAIAPAPIIWQALPA